jgi:response regulator RpfG family c-di-GMP phosphodiesterase/tRNA A-37 threonylcarbamoyl transferase component Bud32
MPALSSHLPGNDAFRRSVYREARSAVEVLVYDLLGSSLVLAEDWERVSSADRERLLRADGQDKALALLVEYGLLTDYQAARVGAGRTFGLVLGNYRVLDRLGSGGMAVVFKAEHLEMRHLVAVKVQPISREQDPRLQTRFSAEMRAVARLRHANIVAAVDAGRAFSHDPDAPVLWYLVMEYVAGRDLEEYVVAEGPLPVAKACDIAHQVACALAETHKFGLVHRDIKPSNVLLTAEDQAKLLDFGLSRRVDHRLTQSGTVLGTLDYMAPEQARDSSTVDVRADIYGLGGTLFWCLTGQLPFPSDGGFTEVLVRRITQPPPALRQARPELPGALEAVVARMMALDPADRYATPQEVMKALLPFLKSRSSSQVLLPPAARLQFTASAEVGAPRGHRILIVDDEPGIRRFCRDVLQEESVTVEEASDGAAALEALARTPYDLVLLDVMMPGLSGPDLLCLLREQPPCPHLKVLMFSGHASPDEMAEMLLGGADGYLGKPFSIVQLQGQVRAVLRLKDAQDQADLLTRRLLGLNAELERGLTARASDLTQVRNALVLALAQLLERRETEGSNRLARLQRYARCLATAASQSPAFAGQVDAAFIDMLVCCAPLHDIGKICLPDHILLKPGKLTPEERLQMQAHTTIGAETLRGIAERHGSALAFLNMAIDIIRHHHERYDGTGYPDRLAGSAVPLAARMITVCDVYDALRSRRPYKPALSQNAALQLMTEASPGQFDPALLQVFAGCAVEFERTFRELAG